MPDVFPREAPEPRSLLGWDGTAFYVVAVDAAGHGQVDVLSSALPSGAATQATLAAILAELTTLNLQHFDSVWRFAGSGAGGAGTVNVFAPTLAANDLVVVTTCYGFLSAGSATKIELAVFNGAVVYPFAEASAPAVGTVVRNEAPIVMVTGDSMVWIASNVGAGTVLNGRAVGYYVRT